LVKAEALDNALFKSLTLGNRDLNIKLNKKSTQTITGTDGQVYGGLVFVSTEHNKSYQFYLTVYSQIGCHLCSIRQSLARACSHVLLLVILSIASCGALWATIATVLLS
jgi:hypothetical protein